MSYIDLVDRVTLFRALHAIDVELAEDCRAGGCPDPECGGPLHRAAYERCPRGERIELAPELYLRLGLCCGWCRRRVLPPSCLFLGRRVYWGCAVMLVTACVQGLEKRSLNALCERFGVARRTVKRWVHFFAVLFPRTRTWQRWRGRVGPQVRDESLPLTLLASFFAASADRETALVECLHALARAEGEVAM
jgi:hypothetical protein